MPQTSHWCNGAIRKHVRIRLDCKKIIIEFQFTIANKSWFTVYKFIILICWRLEVTPPPSSYYSNLKDRKKPSKLHFLPTEAILTNTYNICQRQQYFVVIYILDKKCPSKALSLPSPKVLPSAGHVGHNTLWEQQGGSVPVHPTQIQACLQGVKLC